MLLQGIYASGKAWPIEADKSYNLSKALQDYMRHILKQQSHGRQKKTLIDSCDLSYGL